MNNFFSERDTNVETAGRVWPRSSACSDSKWKGSRQQSRPLCQQPSPSLCLCWDFSTPLSSSCRLLPGYLSTNDSQGSKWIGESIYNQPLRSAHRNERATTVPKICLSAFWLWVVTLLIVTIWQTGRLNNWGYNHWSVSEMHDLLVEKAQLQFDLHCA